MKFNKPSEKLPENCKPVLVTSVMRFNYYKESSAQYKRGIKGRWQEFNGYGWSNCDAPHGWACKEGEE